VGGFHARHITGALAEEVHRRARHPRGPRVPSEDRRLGRTPL